MALLFRIDGDWFHERCASSAEGADYETLTEADADRMARGGRMTCEACHQPLTAAQQADWDYARSLSVV